MQFTYRLARLLFVLLVAGAVTMQSWSQVVTLEGAKKTLTLAMLENTTWSNEQALDAFVIGLYGEDKALQRVLGDYMSDQEVRGKPVIVTAYQSLESARAASILLLTPVESAGVVEITEALRGSGTLIVTEGVDERANFMMNFIRLSSERVTLEVNAGNMLAAGLIPTSEILMFGGTKEDLADVYEYTDAQLERARAGAAEQKQRLDELTHLSDAQQRLLDDQRALQERDTTVEAQRAELEASQRRLASLQDELASVRQLLSESETRLGQTATELEEKEGILAEKEALLASYTQQIERSRAQAEIQLSQAGSLESQRVTLMLTSVALLLLVALLALTFLGYRRKRNLAIQLEGKTLEQRAANEKLAQLTKVESRSMLMTAEVLECTVLTNQQSEYVSKIIKSADTLLGVSNDVYDLSRIEAGRLDLEAIPFSLSDVLGDTLQPLALQASEKGLELTFHIPPDVPDSVIGDPQRLRQVMDNLLGNAISFTDEGEVAVDLQLESGSDEAVRVRFEVRDTGIGIAPEQHDTVLKAFAQAESGTEDEAGGAGVGLAISYQLARLMGGELSVQSKPGEGSSFHFSAEFKLPEGPAPAAQKPLRALVVDDSSTTRVIMEELLDNWGMSVTVADGGKSALNELERAEIAGDSIALALVDAEMPDMDGFELAKKIRQRTTQQAIRILMLTSAGQADTGDLQERLDISSVLLKPAKHSDLLAAITDALGVSAQSVGRPARGAPARGAQASVESRRLLLVEDISENRKVAGEMLGKRVKEQPPVAGEGTDAVEDVTAEAPEEPVEPVEPEETVEPAEVAMSPPPLAMAEQPCLDWAGALRNLEGDEEFLNELAEKFLDEYPGMLTEIEDAVSKGDGGELRRAAHAMTGPAQLIGAIAAAETALQLEKQGHIGNLLAAKETLKELQDELAELKTALVAELPGRGSGGRTESRSG